ncbi:T9SS type A sorting domain-containing protein, partial [bacterium]|nr:T9SS type A sorting domain-containing protein [bacterium]
RVANSTVGNVPYGGTAENSDQPFQFIINPDIAADYLRLTLKVTATGGFTQIFQIKIPVGFPAILLVDDDAGEVYERYYQSMFFLMDQQEHTWSITESGVPAIDFLRQFDAVVWFTGDDDTSAIDSAEQVLISEYLASNGRLLVSGQNIGRDLVTNGAANDQQFYRQVLKSELASDSVSGIGLVGIPGDPIGNGLSARFKENVIPNAQNQLRPDAIRTADAAATGCFMYLPSAITAGIYWQGAENNRLIYLAFGLEGIGGPKPESQWALLEACLNWLRQEFTEIQTPSEIKPAEFSIKSNFPNPFNPATRIQFTQPEVAVIKARIFNSLGQQVRILYNGVLPAGTHILNWDGSDDSGKEAASGIYYLQLTRNVSGKQDSRRLKMLKMK